MGVCSAKSSQIRRLHANDQQVVADIESQAELLLTEDMKSPLI